MECRSERWLGIPSAWARWWVEECVAQGEKVDGVDVIYALMSPYATAEAAAKLAARLGKPWIADLGDPWALDEMMIYPTHLHWRHELSEDAAPAGNGGGDRHDHAARRPADPRDRSPSSADKPIVSIPMRLRPRRLRRQPRARSDR